MKQDRSADLAATIAAAKAHLAYIRMLTEQEVARQGDAWNGTICMCRIGDDQDDENGREYYQSVAVKTELLLADLLAALKPASDVPPIDIDDILVGGLDEGD